MMYVHYRSRSLGHRVRVAVFWLLLGGLHTALGFREQGTVAYVVTAVYALLPHDPVFKPHYDGGLRMRWFVLLLTIAVVSAIAVGFETAFWVVVGFYALSVALVALGILWRTLRRADEPSRL